MKRSGNDAVLIDWPGTGTNNGANMDLPLNERNTPLLEQRISRTVSNTRLHPSSSHSFNV